MARKQTAIFRSYLKGAPKESVDIRDIMKKGEIPKCKYCGSTKLVRYGYYHNIPRWWCKGCKRKFADNKAPPGMKTPADQIASALTMYYEGMGFKVIRRYLQEVYNSYPSDSTVYDWIELFTKKAIAAEKKRKPEVGDVWIADETTLTISGQRVGFWDIIDIKTGFFLASQLSAEHAPDDPRVLLVKAVKKAGKLPKIIITNQLAEYFDGIELSLGIETNHIIARKPRTASGIRLIERFHSSLKARTNVMKGFKNLRSARNVIQGWPVHYNYLRPQDVINDNTPAKKAGIKSPIKIKIR